MTIAGDQKAEFTVPVWPALIIPILQVLSESGTLHRKDLFDRAATTAGLDEAARTETLNSGGLRYEHRMGWVLANTARAGWIERPARGQYAINAVGRAWMAENPDGLTYGQAREVFAPFWPAQAKKPQSSETDLPIPILEVLDPVEQIEDGINRIHQEVGEELLRRLRESHPDFFEQAVVNLLLKMGYGGVEQRGKRIGGTGDEGIDGIIDQDALGLDQVYIQAKRYKLGSNIGRETIQAFVGALHGFGATRGVFITTSAFTPAAISYTAGVPSRIILIDGQRLVDLMIKYLVGVQSRQTYAVVEVDDDFFD